MDPGIVIDLTLELTTLLVVAFGAGRITAKISSVDLRLSRLEGRVFKL